MEGKRPTKVGTADCLKRMCEGKTDLHNELAHVAPLVCVQVPEKECASVSASVRVGERAHERECARERERKRESALRIRAQSERCSKAVTGVCIRPLSPSLALVIHTRCSHGSA